MLIGGVDEAGRGSILGPLVVAGASFRQSSLAELKKMGVRDSKLLMPQARTRLAEEIKSVANSFYVHPIEIAEIDKSVLLNGLNRLEAKWMANAIAHIMADEVYVDCCDTNPDRYRDQIASHLDKSPMIHSMHHADAYNITVSAASILAKVARDLEIQKLRKKHRNIGSGYPSDEKTMLFIRNWVTHKKCAPVFARKSWKPMRLLLEELEQRTLV